MRLSATVFAQMLAAALKAEVAAYIDAHCHVVDENAHRLVVSNGFHEERTVLTAAGGVPVRAPRVNDKRADPDSGERKWFSSAMAHSASGRRCVRFPPAPASSAAGSTSRPMSFPHYLPKSAHPGALAALKDIYNAEDMDKAQVAAKAFELDYGAKYPKAVAKITDDLDVPLEFYPLSRRALDPPAHHRPHRVRL